VAAAVTWDRGVVLGGGGCWAGAGTTAALGRGLALAGNFAVGANAMAEEEGADDALDAVSSWPAAPAFATA